MDKLDQDSEPVQQPPFDLDRAVADAAADSDSAGGEKLHISEEVIREIANRALARVSSVAPASAGGSVLGIGRKNTDGVRVSLEEGEQPQISMDVYVQVKYGLRIPDVAWDLQEFLKNELERATGYAVKAVNIYVQGVFFDEQSRTDSSDSSVQNSSDAASQNSSAKAALNTAGE
jgi:uncharacterized alkaline shock family protein YloU